MKIHLFVVLFVFHLVASGALKAQSAFTFECVCDYVAPPDCDLCNTSVKERLFNGLLIRRYDSATSSYKAFKWIDAPYSVKQRNDELLEIFELVYPSPETVIIPWYATPYDSIQAFQDSIQCYCNGAFSAVAGPGITISGDTISAVDTSAINEGLLGVGAGGSNSALVTSNTTGANGVEIIGGTGIGISEVTSANGGSITVTNTGDLSSTNELQTLSASGAGPTSYNIDLSSSGGTVTLSEGSNIDITRSGNTITIASTSSGGVTSITGERGITVSNVGGAYTVGLPTATASQTLRFDGTNWVSNSEILNNGNEVGIGGSPVAGFELYNNGALRSDGTGVFRGTGDPISTLTAPSVRLWNTGGTGDTWRLSSLDNGQFQIFGDAPGSSLLITTAGQVQTVSTLRIGATTGTPNQLIGRNTSGDVGGISVGSGLSFSAGVLSATGGGSGTVTSVAATAPTSGFTITGSPITTSGTLTFALNNDLLGVENLSTTGLATRTAANTWATRSIVAGSGITVTNGDGVSGNITIAATGGGGTVTGANNLLTLSGSNVQFGGTATQNNTANHAGFYLAWLNGRNVFNRYNSNTLINANVVTGFDVSGLASNPQFVASPTEDAVATFRGTTVNAGSYNANALSMGVYPTTANGFWLQSRSESAYTTVYPLVLQPLGGKFAVNRSGTPPPAYATISGGGMAGTGASGNVLMLENSEGNGYAELGFSTTVTTTASNTYNAGVGYTSGDNSNRLYNLSTAAGAAVRIGVGGRTNDKVVITADNTIGRLGAGFSTTTGLHSTMQSGGSLAAAVREATGATTLNESDHTLLFTGSANSTFTLPTASTCVGRIYVIGHIGSGGTVTLSAAVTNGSGTTFNTVTSQQWATIIARSSGWVGFKVASL